MRVGNAAADQYQLDVYGEVMSALYTASRSGGVQSQAVWDLQLALMDFLKDGWALPDDGIWEVRGPRRHFTHSKVMAWVAVDRAVRTIEDCPELGGPLDDWRALRDQIHQEVCDKGFNEEKQAFTQYYGSTTLDASILMMPLVGFLPPSDPRVVSTVEAIERELTEDGFVLRYKTSDDGAVDGLTGREGAFLACSFWLADCLHMIGRVEDATTLFERLLGLRTTSVCCPKSTTRCPAAWSGTSPRPSPTCRWSTGGLPAHRPGAGTGPRRRRQGPHPPRVPRVADGLPVGHGPLQPVERRPAGPAPGAPGPHPAPVGGHPGGHGRRVSRRRRGARGGSRRRRGVRHAGRPVTHLDVSGEHPHRAAPPPARAGDGASGLAGSGSGRIGEGVLEIDTMLGGWERVTAGYLVEGPAPVLVETGSQSSVPVLLATLGDLGLGPGDLAGMVVTHIHLDHAGGVGDVAQAFPNATVYVHEKGRPPPGRSDHGWSASAAQVYGPLLDSLYGRLDPTPPERLHVLADGEEIEVAPGRC